MANKLRKLFHLREKNLVVIKRVKLVSYDMYSNSTLAKKMNKKNQD